YTFSLRTGLVDNPAVAGLLRRGRAPRVGRAGPAAVAENGSRRPVDWRCCARFQQSPLIIIGNLGIAKRGVVEARAERALNNALIGAERAAQLTQRLLAFSRRQPLNPRVLDVNKLIV